MAKVNIPSLPTKSLSYFVMLGGGIILFVLLAIMPVQKESEALDFEIENINIRIKEQKILTPVYENLLKRAQMKPPEGLNFVPKQKLEKGDTEKVAATFKSMANDSQLMLVDFSPALDTLINRTGFLMVDIVLQGEFINLHPFLLQLCQLTYMEQIEHVSIQSVRKTKEIKLRVWLAHE
jgi:hypothetical protein